MSKNEPQPNHVILPTMTREVRMRLAAFGVAAVASFLVAGAVLSAAHFLSPQKGVAAAAQAGQVTAVAQESSEEAARPLPDQAAPDEGGQAPDAPAAVPAPAALTCPSSPSSRDEDFAVDAARCAWDYQEDGKKVVYLTIDDGPSENTQAVLDILDRYGCKATFFVVGHNADYFPMISEAYRRGHTIGLHTYSHDYAEVYASEDAYFADLDAIGQVVREQIGYIPCFIRFPGGSSNDISANYSEGIMSRLVEQVRARGYQYFDWNLSVGDGADHTADEIVGYGTEPVEGDAVMLLCHDSATKQSTVEALPSIIEHYQQLGYEFRALDRHSWACHHGVNN